MVISPLLFALLVFLLLVAAFVGLSFATAGDVVQRRRLVHPSVDSTSSSVLVRESVEWRGVPQKLLTWRLRRLRRGGSASGRVRKLQNLLVYAGFNGLASVAVFRLIQIAAMAVGGGIGLLASYAMHQSMVVWAVLGAILSYVVTEVVLRKLGDARQATLARELPAALDLLVVSLEAGLGIGEAIKVVGYETERQGRLLGGELSTVGAEMGAGLSLEDALRNLDQRTGVEDIKSLAGLIVQCEKVGGRLGPALRASSDLLTTKRRLRAEEAAQKSAIKMLIPLVLLILPAMMIVILGPAVLQIVHVLTGSH